MEGAGELGEPPDQGSQHEDGRQGPRRKARTSTTSSSTMPSASSRTRCLLVGASLLHDDGIQHSF